ncbi:hypothetical protein StoSoilB22_15430 [Arthrobacter sp. StoSoilB22]|nr:hypothetical protein StoSoilB22_15430 [Arthrobacter sp. StoSoilB22]
MRQPHLNSGVRRHIIKVKVMTDTSSPRDPMPENSIYQDVEGRSVLRTFGFNHHMPRRCRPRRVDSGAHPGTLLQPIRGWGHEQRRIKASELLPSIGVVNDLESSGPLGVHRFHGMELYRQRAVDYETIAE